MSSDGKTISMDVTTIINSKFSKEQKDQMKGFRFSLALKKA